MKSTKTIIVPAREYQQFALLTCDLCGNTTKNEECWPAKGQESTGTSNKNFVTIALEHGYNCPDGGEGTKTIFDICPDCFRSKLAPWFVSQGAAPREEKWEW